MRLVTRGDLDGVTSAVLITTMETIDFIELIHPQDITDRRFAITGDDIMANLPYHPSARLWFDHHELTLSNQSPPAHFRGRHAIAPSASRVIYDYYASDKLRRYEYLVGETDRFDSATLSRRDIIDPEGVILLGFTIDSRSGLGSFKSYFNNLVSWLKTIPLERVLSQADVRERAMLLRENNAVFLQMLSENSRQDGNVVITDFRSFDKAPVGNRFLIYTLYPDANVSVRVQWGPEKKSVAVSLGHNIFNRTSKANCGRICSIFEGGGHKGAGSCLLPANHADFLIAEIVKLLKNAG
jgi:nanoRNase/pAp phosphatase (c-di-AMP/oligoRNAs hydrolase)